MTELILLVYCNLLFTWDWFIFFIYCLVTLYMCRISVTFQPLWNRPLSNQYVLLFVFPFLKNWNSRVSALFWRARLDLRALSTKNLSKTSFKDISQRRVSRGWEASSSPTPPPRYLPSQRSTQTPNKALCDWLKWSWIRGLWGAKRHGLGLTPTRVLSSICEPRTQDSKDSGFSLILLPLGKDLTVCIVFSPFPKASLC